MIKTILIIILSVTFFGVLFFILVRNALNEDLFRYDASELMERRIGADHLLYALKKYISLGSEFINEVTEELDSKY